jgi:hypothetical protein
LAAKEINFKLGYESHVEKDSAIKSAKRGGKRRFKNIPLPRI